MREAAEAITAKPTRAMNTPEWVRSTISKFSSLMRSASFQLRTLVYFPILQWTSGDCRCHRWRRGYYRALGRSGVSTQGAPRPGAGEGTGYVGGLLGRSRHVIGP